MTEVLWNRMTAEELRRRAEEDAIVLLPVASTPHLATGVDTFLGGEGCRLTALIVARSRPIVVGGSAHSNTVPTAKDDIESARSAGQGCGLLEGLGDATGASADARSWAPLHGRAGGLVRRRQLAYIGAGGAFANAMDVGRKEGCGKYCQAWGRVRHSGPCVPRSVRGIEAGPR